MNKTYKIVAVILNYKSWEEAVACVDSLLKMEYENHEIVIVDNGSGNDSIEQLTKIYSDKELVHIVMSRNNLGFARGNNLGIKYARTELNADFIYVANSDTINSSLLYKQILNKYKEGIGLISPTVQKKDGSYHLPAINTDNISKSVREAFINSLYSYLCFNRMVRNASKHTKNVLEPFEDTERNLCVNKYVIQGCAYFLTPDFLKEYDGLYPCTFLYWEELNLLQLMEKADLETVLAKTDNVIHMVNSSTNLFFKERERNRCKMSLQSAINSVPLWFMKKKKIQKIIKKNNKQDCEYKVLK